MSECRNGCWAVQQNNTRVGARPKNEARAEERAPLITIITMANAKSRLTAGHTRPAEREREMADKPAVIRADGLRWYRNGVPHRDFDKPAVVDADGTLMWYRNGRLHREGDMPAVTRADGTHMWYRNGRIHREDDEPAVIWADGTQEWWLDGELQRKEL